MVCSTSLVIWKLHQMSDLSLLVAKERGEGQRKYPIACLGWFRIFKATKETFKNRKCFLRSFRCFSSCPWASCLQTSPLRFLRCVSSCPWAICLQTSPSDVSQVVHRPKSVVCKKKSGSCKHEIVFDQHYNKAAWNKYADYVKSAKSTTVIDEDYIP